jgi:hypothetical protein
VSPSGSGIEGTSTNPTSLATALNTILPLQAWRTNILLLKGTYTVTSSIVLASGMTIEGTSLTNQHFSRFSKPEKTRNAAFFFSFFFLFFFSFILFSSSFFYGLSEFCSSFTLTFSWCFSFDARFFWFLRWI